MNREERHVKRLEKRIELHKKVFRALLNLLIITIVGTVTVFATRPQTNWGALISLGLYAILVLAVGCLGYFLYVNKEINRL
jgi:hypothetical protein